ncbi:MAG: c-type cytochrome, partial [Planctomycetota bacterium]
GKIPAGAKTLMFADITDPFHFLDGVPYVDHAIHCAEYCGDFHSDMAAVIRIIPKDAFAEWLKKGDAALPPVQRGQKIWETNCQTCHSIDGTLRTGPSWKDLFGRTETMTDGSTVVVDDNYTRESIYEPQKRIVGGFGGVIMPTFAGALDADQINALIAYMKSISVNAKEEPDPADPKPDAKPGDKPGDKPEAKPDAKPEAKPAETPKAEPKK